MKKRKMILGTIMVGFSIMSLSSCLIINRSSNGSNRNLSYKWSESDYNKLKNNMAKFEDALENSNDYNLVSSWTSVQTALYNVATYRTIENINYAAGDNEAYDKYIYFSGIVDEVSKWQENLYDDMYNSKYKDSFFQGMTEEEIAELLNRVKPDRYYELEDSQEALIKQYQDLSKEQINTETSDIYLALVKNYKEEATLLGYNNYMDYAYKEIYEREYTPLEVEGFNTYVKNHIVPMLYEVKTKAKDVVSNLSYQDKAKYSSFSSGSFKDNLDIIKRYGTFVGDSFKKSLDYVLSKGYIVYGGENSNIDGAYTTYLYATKYKQPIMYFGPNYQNTMTFIHEFGHYNNFKINKATALSYDLAETQSQGNELLFLAWLEKNVDSYSNIMDAIRLSEVYEALTTIVLSAMVNGFEYKVYTSGDTLKASDFDTFYREVGDELGGYDDIMNCLYGGEDHIDYWKLVTIENPVYYISYAMSKIPSLEIYAQARNNLALARTNYTKTYTLDSSLKLTDFLGVLESANLYSPFDEKAYQLIKELK